MIYMFKDNLLNVAVYVTDVIMKYSVNVVLRLNMVWCCDVHGLGVKYYQQPTKTDLSQ